MAKQWPAQEVPWIVNQAFREIVGRGVLDGQGTIIDAASLMTYGCSLMRGEMSVRDLVRVLATSPEFIGKIVDAMPFHEALARCFALFLGRAIDDQARHYYTQCYEQRHWSMRDIILDLINSQEYSSTHGEDMVPMRRVYA